MKNTLEENVSFDFIRYANCWEDADVLLKGLDPEENKRFLSIASAGDNSFSLLVSNPELVVAVDVNQNQLFLVELKREAIRQMEYNEEHGITPTTIKRNIHDIVAHTAAQDSVLVDTGDDERNNLVGHNLRSYIEDLEKRMRDAAANLEFEEAGRLRDEIRRLEADELGIPDGEKRAPIVGRSNEGKPGTRKMRYGKTQRKWGK